MCGIAGIYDQRSRLSRQERECTVQRLCKKIRHRGPDESGVHSGATCTIGMQRLSVIDLQTGTQPILNEDGSVAVVFNGEIYNYLELRQDLIRLGHTFKTNSDTEVLVHLYEEYGESMLSRLEGMFAFCLYDTGRSRLLLARDRFGEKPLFYHHRDGLFTFSSEIRSLLENPKIERFLNDEALVYYLTVGFIPEPLTMFRGVMSLLRLPFL